MLDIIDSLTDHIDREAHADGTETWSVLNPSMPSENLASSMNTPERQAAFNAWHRKVGQDVASIAEAIEEQAGMDVLLKRIEHAFGPRASRAVRDDQAQRRLGSRQTGHVALIPAVGAPITAIARPHNFFGQ